VGLGQLAPGRLDLQLAARERLVETGAVAQNVVEDLLA